MKKTQPLSSNLIQLTVRYRRFLILGLFLVAGLALSVTQWRKGQNTQAAGLPPVVCGTKSVGPGGDYATLTAAFADLNVNGVTCQVVLELQANYTSAGETFPLQLNQVVGASATNTITIRPQAGATGLIITTNAIGTFYLNGADYVIFDGRPGGVGSAKELTIENTQTPGGLALDFFNSASNNVAQYCKFKGSNQFENGGVIYFSGYQSPVLTGGAVNNNNTIDNCEVSDSSSGLPYNLIYAHDNGSSSGTTVSNNHLYNFFPGSAVAALGNHTAWTINGNRIFQQAARTGDFNKAAIHINGSVFSGGDLKVTNNVIGYAAADGTGTYTLQGNFGRAFTGISVSFPTGAPSAIEGNTIAGIALTGPRNRFTGIIAGQGQVNINNNTIGSETATDSIVNTNTTTGNGDIFGIYCTDGNPTVIKNVKNNRIGGLTMRGDTLDRGGSVTGIFASTGRYTFSDNFIGLGGETNHDSLRCGDAGATGECSLTGISLGSYIETAEISGNTIANFKHNSTLGGVRGITGAAGTHLMTDNMIRDLASVAGGSFPYLVGIEISGGTATIARNTVHSLANTNSAATESYVIGMDIQFFTNTGGNATVERNYVHSLSRAATGGPSFSGDGIALRGILVRQAVDRFIVRNNMIRLGYEANGNSLTGAMRIVALGVGSQSLNAQVYFNSVYLGGTGVGTGSADTYAFQGDSTSPRDYRNNIFVNARSNASTGGKHYAYFVSTTPPTSNYNLYLANGMGGVLAKTGTTDRATLAALQGALPGQDLNSLVGDPFFVNPNGNAATVNLHILASACSPAANAGNLMNTNVTNDIDNHERIAPPDIGADEFMSIPPPISILPANQTACFGSTTPLPFAVTASGTNPSYVWTLDGNATGGNAANISINPSGLSPGNHVVAVMVTSSCGTVSANTTLTINALPTPTTTGASRCGSGSVTLTASGSGGMLKWYSDAGLTNLVNTGSSFSPNLSATTTYYVTETSAAGCVSAASSVTATVYPPPDADAGPDRTLTCATTSVTLDGSSTMPGATFSWSGPGGYTSNAAAPTVSVAGVYTLTVTNPANGCTAGDSVTVTENTAPPDATITVAPEVCAGATGIVASVPDAGAGAAYLWILTNGTVTSGEGSNTITFTAGTSGSVTIFAGVQGENECYITSSKNVTIKPAAAITVPPSNQEVCFGNSAPMSFAVTATGTSLAYAWTLDGNATGGNAANVAIDPSSLAVGPHTVSVTVTGECGAPVTTSATLTVNANPSAVITAPVTVCSTSIGNMASVPDAGAGASYAWTITNGTITAGAGTEQISWTAGTSGATTLSVTVTTASGCSGSATKTVTVNPTISFTPPTLPEGAVGLPYVPTSFVAAGGSGPVTFSLTSGSLPNGMSLVSGQLAGMPTQYGNFPITITATDGVCSASRDYMLVVNCPTIVISPGTIPSAELNMAYPAQTFSAGAGNAPYTFSQTGALPTGMSFTGATLSGTPMEYGDFPITIHVTDQYGCTASRSYTLEVNRKPVANCKNVNVTAGAGGTAMASIDDGSFDPDGDTITLTQSPAGPYSIGTTSVTLTVTDDQGASSSCTATVTVTGSTQGLSDFVVFSQEHTYLRANTQVFTGNVGANTSLPDSNGHADDKEEVEIGQGVKMLQAGSKVVGDTVRLRANSQVYDVHYNELDAHRTDILGIHTTPLTLPVLTLPSLPAFTPGTQDVEVPRNDLMTLAPGNYRKLTVNHKGALILSAGIYHISSLDIRQDAGLYFIGPVEVWVKNEMDTDSKVFIGPHQSVPGLMASQIIFYVQGVDDQGRRHDGDENLAPTVVQIGERNTVKANIYAPNGTVWLKANTEATGAFLGKAVRIGERVKLWLKSSF